MKRRDFLKLAGAVTVAGCATATASKARVVVVGGGFGGATAAKYIRLWDPSIDVVLVERDASFVSCPISNLVLAGYSSMQEITRGYDGLRRHGLRTADRFTRHRLHLRRHRGLRGRHAGRHGAARLESRPADRGIAAPARRDARRRRLRPFHSARPVSLPAGAVRARERGRGLFQAGEAALEGAGGG